MLIAANYWKLLILSACSLNWINVSMVLSYEEITAINYFWNYLLFMSILQIYKNDFNLL